MPRTRREPTWTAPGRKGSPQCVKVRSFSVDDKFPGYGGVEAEVNHKRGDLDGCNASTPLNGQQGEGSHPIKTSKNKMSKVKAIGSLQKIVKYNIALIKDNKKQVCKPVEF